MSTNWDAIIAGLFGIAGTVISYIVGRRAEKSKINRDNMDIAKQSADMVAPLLETGRALAAEVRVLREELQHSAQKALQLEQRVEEYRKQAEQCTCGAFTQNQTV